MTYQKTNRYIFTCIAAILIAAWSGSAFGHGGKTHGQKVTALNAIEKAAPLFSTLIQREKIDIAWETALRRVSVAPWSGAGENGWMVVFFRESGQPATLYIFLDPMGNYAGSNFTGQK